MQDDERIARKNKPLPESELPDWMKAMPAEEREKYTHSPQCKVCTATNNGRNLRSEIEALVIERKTHTEACNVMYDRYGLRLNNHNISRHMARHAPNYAKVFQGLLESELGEVLQGGLGPIVDPFKFLLAVLQVAWHRLLENPNEVSLTDGIRAAEKLHLITQDLDIRYRDDAVSQADITAILDIMQDVMTPEQRKEVRERFHVTISAEASPLSRQPDPESAPRGDEGVKEVVVDGELIPIDKIHTLPPEEPREGG